VIEKWFLSYDGVTVVRHHNDNVPRNGYAEAAVTQDFSAAVPGLAPIDTWFPLLWRLAHKTQFYSEAWPPASFYGRIRAASDGRGDLLTIFCGRTSRCACPARIVIGFGTGKFWHTAAAHQYAAVRTLAAITTMSGALFPKPMPVSLDICKQLIYALAQQRRLIFRLHRKS